MQYVDVPTAKKISKIGLGTWQFGSAEWGYGDRYADSDTPVIVRRALELGITLFDTAEIYGVDASSLACRALVRGIAWSETAAMGGFGRGELILGRALARNGASGFVATKFYPAVPVSPDVYQHAEASAKRLGSRRPDLYQLHQPGRVIRNSALLRRIRGLQRDGLVDEIGLNGGSVRVWRAAEDALGGRVLTNQVNYSLAARSPEQEVLPFAEAHGRVVIAHSPLARGLLSGRYDRVHQPTDYARTAHPLFLSENLDRAKNLITVLREVGDVHSATPAQVALAWVIRHPAVVAIPGASSVDQLESNAAAADIKLSDDEYQALRAASDRFSPIPDAASHRARTRLWDWYAN